MGPIRWVFDGDRIYEAPPDSVQRLSADHFYYNVDEWVDSFNFQHERRDPASLRAQAARAVEVATMYEALRSENPLPDDIDRIVRLGIEYDSEAHVALMQRRKEQEEEVRRREQEWQRTAELRASRLRRTRECFRLLREAGHDIYACAREIEGGGYLTGDVCSRCGVDRWDLFGSICEGIGNRFVVPPCDLAPPGN